MINLGKSIDLLTKRGPDSRGSFVDDFIGLGHRRLSIIDTSHGGHQPMTDSGGRYVIIFNGEIFNYRELKKELEDKGCQFSTNSDTEVLLQLYIYKKEKCLNDLIGFFAFAVFDKHEKELFIARDRFGIKPLVYYYDEDKFAFASEMKSLLAYNIPREIDYTSIYQYFQFRYIPSPKSIFKNIAKLEPGHFMLVKNKKTFTSSYYNLQNEESRYNLSDYEKAKEKLKELLEDSVQRRMIADVPLGAFLSGGIDSSVIVALASKYTADLNTFSIGYKDEPFFDETKYADLVAKKYNTNHTVFSLSNDDLFDDLFNVLEYIDEPFADSSSLPMYILSRHTSKKVKVALWGDGADEVFAGYNKYMGEYKSRNAGLMEALVKNGKPLWKLLPKSRNGYISDKIRQLHRFAEGMSLSNKERAWLWSSIIPESSLKSVFSENLLSLCQRDEYENRKKEILRFIDQSNNMNDLLLMDMHSLLPSNMLYKVDMMSMANSLEVRVPFLDHRLVNFAFTLPENYKINGRIKKKIVQETFRDILPPELYRRPKHGFDVPLLKWYRKELRKMIKEDLLADDFILAQKIFNPVYISKLKEQLFSGQMVDQEHIWSLIVFQYWWKKYMNDRSE